MFKNLIKVRPGGHERDGHNFFAVSDEDEGGGFLVVSPEGMADVGEGG